MTGPTYGFAEISYLENSLMKKFLLASAALITLTATVPALAADLGARTYTKAPMMAPAVVYNWTGFYIGGHVGGAFHDNTNDFGPLFFNNNNDNNGRFLAGGQIGADYQFGQSWVIGFEGQYSWIDRNNNNNFGVGLFGFNSQRRGLASATGRLGYTWGPALLYVKGGYAYSDHRDDLNFGGLPLVGLGGGRHDGYTVGGGLEYMFAQNWSAKVEYMYYNFDRDYNFAGAPLFRFRDDEHTIKAGLNYRFGLGGPVVARY